MKEIDEKLKGFNEVSQHLEKEAKQFLDIWNGYEVGYDYDYDDKIIREVIELFNKLLPVINSSRVETGNNDIVIGRTITRKPKYYDRGYPLGTQSLFEFICDNDITENIIGKDKTIRDKKRKIFKEFRKICIKHKEAVIKQTTYITHLIEIEPKEFNHIPETSYYNTSVKKTNIKISKIKVYGSKIVFGNEDNTDIFSITTNSLDNEIQDLRGIYEIGIFIDLKDEIIKGIKAQNGKVKSVVDSKQALLDELKKHFSWRLTLSSI